MTQDQQQLVVEHVKLAQVLLRVFLSRNPRLRAHADELESCASDALMECAIRFEPERNIHFRTYANHRIRGALLDWRREFLGTRRRSPKRKLLLFGDLCEDQHASGRSKHPSWLTAKAAKEPTSMEESEWARLLKPLTPHQRKILSLRYRIGLSEKEVAIMLGLSESTIGTTCAHCIRELRSLFSHTNTRLAAAS